MYLGVSHGLGMTAVYVPSAQLLYAADIVTPNSVAFYNLPDYNTVELVVVIEKLLELDWTMGVWSHSDAEDVLVPTDRTPAEDNVQYLKDLRMAILQEMGQVKYLYQKHNYET